MRVPANLRKFIGVTADIIYIDRSGSFTQRTIRLHSVEGDLVRAFCYRRGAVRCFKASNLLAIRISPQSAPHRYSGHYRRVR